MARSRKVSIELEALDLVLIKWVDAAGSRERDEADPVPCLSVGWVIEVGEKDGAHFVKLAGELLTDDDGATFDTLEHVSIPAGMIRSVVKIKTKHPAPFDAILAQARDA